MKVRKPSGGGPRRLHLWFPNIFEFKGGIQVYSLFLLAALQGILPERRYRVFLKHDRAAPPTPTILPQTRFHCSGRVPLRWRTAAFAAQIAAWGALQRPELIISSHVHFAVVAAQLQRWLGIPYWVVAHGVEVWQLRRPDLQNALRRADRILAVSGYTRDRLLAEQDLDPQRVVILPNTFAAECFRPGPKPLHLLNRHQLRPEQPTLLTVTRLDASQPYKGYDQILQALPTIRQQFPDVHYLIVGKGSDRPRLEGLIQALDLSDCVTLVGFVPDDELPDYYNLGDVFAMPSRGEGFGIVYLEALACGKPVLGGNQDGALDALCHGELGALVDPGDVGAIAQTLITLLQGTYPHPLLYQPAQLRAKVIEAYGLARFTRTLARLLAVP
ncbi:MAG: glycosyltransferase family 4 protein [Spirulinaceae cyanobacterium SM2_1_0]|nr:glycosyltransferase family 4 protein [Spirulinaceae cyanobacterium SM2_1_0]